VSAAHSGAVPAAAGGGAKPAAPAVDFLPRALLFRLLLVLAVVLAPHLQHMPVWAVLFVCAVGVWRLLAGLRQWRQPPRWVRFAVTIAAFAGVFATFGRISGQTAGVTLLTVMATLKLTELNARRDLMVMVLMMYFMLVTHFLFSQEIWTIAYLLVCVVLITGLLIDAAHPGSALGTREMLRRSGILVAQALPLMAVLFVLFPRIPGPLWGVPSDSGASRSGIADDMAPGEFDQLIESSDVAFRVRFDGAPPPMRERYWRGPVLGHFDGWRWEIGTRARIVERPRMDAQMRRYSYEIELEPTHRRWLFAMDLPRPLDLPADSSLNVDYQLVASSEVKELQVYRLESFPAYRLQPDLPDSLRRVFLQLPSGRNPRTQALAQGWRDKGLADAQIVDAALAMYRDQQFFYTLHPPKFDRQRDANTVDKFLFETRRGFCEHYASSFTVLMRFAGIPARVVTGYQGGQLNGVGDYYVVRQSEAHAWSEVWLADRGWVRVDPTAAVAPERVEDGIGSALSDAVDLAALDPARRGPGLFTILAARWDWANEQWNRWVLGYGPTVQQDFLQRLGLTDWSDMVLALTVILAAILGLLGLALMRQFMPRQDDEPALRAWRKLQRRLARTGLRQAASEGPLDFAQRVSAARPDLAQALHRIASLYLQMRYLGGAAPSALKEMRQEVAALRV
jgi:transglutaminase-like putative cysteine protease